MRKTALLLLLLPLGAPKLSLLSKLALPFSDARRSGGALVPLPAGAGRYEEEELLPKAEPVCQLSRRALSRRGPSRSGRPKVLSRIAVLPGRPPVTGTSLLGRDLLSTGGNNTFTNEWQQGIQAAAGLGYKLILTNRLQGLKPKLSRKPTSRGELRSGAIVVAT